MLFFRILFAQTPSYRLQQCRAHAWASKKESPAALERTASLRSQNPETHAAPGATKTCCAKSATVSAADAGCSRSTRSSHPK